MRVIGIVAEFNPFHNGHEYLIQKAREAVDDKRALVMVVMSGPFTQRGLPAILPPYIRANQALACGADVVIELPFTFACSPSERFSSGAVKLLKSTGVVTDIAFGIDAGNEGILMALTDIESNKENKEKIDNLISESISNGASFPSARANALLSVAEENGLIKDDEEKSIWSETLRSPNSILAMEYIKEVKKSAPKFKIHMIERTGSGYSSTDTNSDIPSATAIRGIIRKSQKSETPVSDIANNLLGKMPDKSLAIMLSKLNELNLPDMDKYAEDLILNIQRGVDDQTAYGGDDLPNYLKNTINSFKNFGSDSLFDDLSEALRTKHYTMGRIYRFMASHVVGQSSEYVKTEDRPRYIRILGFDKEGRYCLKIMGKCSKLPIISNCSDYLEHYSSNPELKLQAEMNNMAYSVQASYLGLPSDYHKKIPPVQTK